MFSNLYKYLYNVSFFSVGGLPDLRVNQLLPLPLHLNQVALAVVPLRKNNKRLLPALPQQITREVEAPLVVITMLNSLLLNHFL